MSGRFAPGLQSLQNGISDRQKELRSLVGILGTEAYTMQRRSNWMRVTTIALSAISATKGVSDKIWGADNVSPLLAFTVIGIVTTALLGIEVAFEYEKRSADIGLLSASWQATIITVDSEWRRNIGSVDDSNLRDEARKRLSLQDTKLAEIDQKAAALGLNITIDVRDLENTDDVPYAA